MHELLALKNTKLEFVYLNFNALIRSKGRLFVLDILEYIKAVENAATFEETNILKLDIGSPLSVEEDPGIPSVSTATKADIIDYLKRKISKVYSQHILNKINLSDELEHFLYKEIINFLKGSNCSTETLSECIEECVGKTNIL